MSLPALDRHGVGHHNDNAVTSRGGDGSKANAVLPLVGSMMTVSASSRPFASASSIMALAMRSLIEPAGSKYSDFRDETGAQTVVVLVIRQLDKRRVANELEDVLVYAHGMFLPYS